MSWINFCRINQAIEELTPTASISRIKNSWDTFDDKETLMSLFAMEYPMNNLGQKKAIKWISEALEVFEDEIGTHIDIYGDIGEGLYFFDDGNEDSDLTLKQAHSLLSLDCSRIESNAFILFSLLGFDRNSTLYPYSSLNWVNFISFTSTISPCFFILI